MKQTRLERLENEAIRLLREAAAAAERPALIRHAGAAGVVLADLARRAFLPAVFPFPLVDEDGGRGHDLLLVAEGAAGPEHQPWELLNVRPGGGAPTRVSPLAAWSELDIWRYLAHQKIGAAGDPPPGISRKLAETPAEVRVLICGAQDDVNGALARCLSGLVVAGREVAVVEAPAGEKGTGALLGQAWAADLVVLVIGAARGATAETRRQLVTLSALGTRRLVVAVSEMEQVGFGAGAFAAVQATYRKLASELALPADPVVPVSAVAGDNVAARSAATPWYEGPTLQDALAAAEPAPVAPADPPLRLPIQWVSE